MQIKWELILMNDVKTMEGKTRIINPCALFCFLFPTIFNLCICQNNLEFQAEESLANVRFDTYLNEHEDVPSIVFCAQFCLRRSECLSFSFRSIALLCRTHDIGFTRVSTGVSEQGWQYFTSKCTQFPAQLVFFFKVFSECHCWWIGC